MKTAKKAAPKARAKKVFCVMCPKWEIKRPERCSNTIGAGASKKYFCTARCKERYAKSAA